MKRRLTQISLDSMIGFTTRCAPVDEKWFYVQVLKQRLYLTEGEGGPICRTTHKGHMEKVMLLTTDFASLRFEEDRVCTFDD
jgi:hypothetical protein